MQIQLKQREIEAALRGYITKQGISLSGRTLTIAFTSGRSGNGLTADISIEEADIPGFGDDASQDEPAVGLGSEDSQEEPAKAPAKATKPALKAVGNDADEPASVSAASPVFGDPVADSAAVTEPVKAGTSLFN